MITNHPLPYMQSLSSCRQEMIKEGYNHNFSITDNGIYFDAAKKLYEPNAYKIINCYLFEGMSATEAAILYVIETADGLKGTFIRTGACHLPPSN